MLAAALLVLGLFSGMGCVAGRKGSNANGWRRGLVKVGVKGRKGIAEVAVAAFQNDDVCFVIQEYPGPKGQRLT